MIFKILETSDVHGNVRPINYGLNQPAPLGLAKISTLIQKEKEDADGVLTIDNGDLTQGTPFTYYYAKGDRKKVNPMIRCANAIGYDAIIFGNHEFNYGLPYLKAAVRDSQMPWLAANIVDRESGDPYFGTPYLIKTYAEGLKVAVLGLTTHYIPNWEKEENYEGIEFIDCVESAREWVGKIRLEEEPDLLIVSYHGGFERDHETGEPLEALTGENQGVEICRQVEGIDILLTGHQHRTISDARINGVHILQPGSNAEHLGKIEIDFEKKEDGWAIMNLTSEIIPAGDTVPDEALLKLTEEDEKETQVWLDQPMGHIKGDMQVKDPLALRMGDHPLIEFINKVQMDAAGTTISNTALFNNESPGFPEDVTMRDIVANYIYPNTLKVLRITGADMRAALEQSARYFAQYNGRGPVEVNPKFMHPKPQHFNYDMWEGIDYVLDISKPENSRVVSLKYNGEEVEDTEEFDVVMNNYRAGGGGNYFMYQDRPVIKDIPIDVSELIADFILKHKVIEADLNHNWHVTY